jgi:ribosomal-protein-alanine N-acetyltransferase
VSGDPAGGRRAAIPVAIRDAEAADLDRVAEIERLSFSDPWSRQSFASLLRNEHVHFRVALTTPVSALTPAHASPTSAAVVGYVVAWLVVDEAEVANVAVDPAARGLGVGARLLDDVLTAARRNGAAAAYLEVRDSNVAARALYASRGFQQVGRRRRYYRRPVEDALVMRRELDPGARDAAP